MKTCFFIGHRNAPESLRPLLDAVIERHIVQYGVANFVVGRYGSFDRLAAQALRDAKQRHPKIRLTLLVPYYDLIKPIELPPGFDDSLYPDGLELVPKRAMIMRTNRYMIQRSDYLIAYDAGHIGNTRELVKYARRREERGLIRIENLAEEN
ncbi:MAG: hypothetical protein IJ769_03735 [Clostridia bacterium]|nr:hypothetical protein [Clostridia bacterium]